MDEECCAGCRCLNGVPLRVRVLTSAAARIEFASMGPTTGRMPGERLLSHRARRVLEEMAYVEREREPRMERGEP